MRAAGRHPPRGPGGDWTPGATWRVFVALVFRCSPIGGTEQTSTESQAVSWLTAEEVDERMNETFAIRVLDALGGGGPHVRTHGGYNTIIGE